MNPYVAFFGFFCSFVAGTFIGWKWRELHLWEEIRNNKFDPVRWGRKE